MRRTTRRGWLPDCEACGGPQAQPGALELLVGPPNRRGICKTRKRHLCRCCYEARLQ